MEASIIASYATGSANGGEGDNDRVGGLAGQQAGGGAAIIASYATGKADGGIGNFDHVGGLVGWQLNGDIIASYATGDANGGEGTTDRVGGLVGLQSIDGSIIASYATGSADGGEGDTDNVGGLVGCSDCRSPIDTSQAMALARQLGEVPDGVNRLYQSVSDVFGFDGLRIAGEMQWGGSPSPWRFGGGLAPRLGYITGARVFRPGMMSTMMTMRPCPFARGGRTAGSPYLLGQ